MKRSFSYLFLIAAHCASAFTVVRFAAQQQVNFPLLAKTENDDSASNNENLDRRKALLVGTSLLSSMVVQSTMSSQSAQAYDNREFPEELELIEGQQALDGRQRMLDRLQGRNYKRRRTSAFISPQPLSATIWGAALWFLSGSRSNPLVTPVANVFYDPEEQKWLKDRNEGLFGDLPIPLFLLMGVIFVSLGFLVDVVATNQILEGDRNLSLQLASVLLISGGALELGRIFSGEKKPTREESDRDDLLTTEFNEFAEERLLLGGNCHRSDVVRAFRRFYAKYRQADSEEYPLSDLEIEQLLRAWGRSRGMEMSSAGFFNGIKVNQDADVFVSR